VPHSSLNNGKNGAPTPKSHGYCAVKSTVEYHSWREGGKTRFCKQGKRDVRKAGPPALYLASQGNPRQARWSGYLQTLVNMQSAALDALNDLINLVPKSGTGP